MKQNLCGSTRCLFFFQSIFVEGGGSYSRGLRRCRRRRDCVVDVGDRSLHDSWCVTSISRNNGLNKGWGGLLLSPAAFATGRVVGAQGNLRRLVGAEMPRGRKRHFHSWLCRSALGQVRNPGCVRATKQPTTHTTQEGYRTFV